MTRKTYDLIIAIRPYLPCDENSRISDVLDRYVCEHLSESEALRLIFWIVWEWASSKEWWPEFVSQNGDYQTDEPAAGLKECGWIDTYIIDPDRFPQLITDFLREKEKGEGER